MTMGWRTKIKPPAEVSATATLSVGMECAVNWPLPPDSAWPSVFYRLYRNGALLVDSISYTNATRVYVDRSVVGVTTYSYAVSVVNSLGNESQQRSSTVVVTPEESLGWLPFAGPIFTQGTATNWSFDAYDPPIANSTIASVGTPLPADVSLNSTSKLLVYGGGGSVGITSGHILDSNTAEADWQARIAGTGVVWYHDFRAASEVNAFRWQNGFGNDPNSQSFLGPQCRRIITDGITGGGCLEIERPAGSGDPPGWWRPFAPLLAPGNGKTTDDPAANGTLVKRTWTGLTNTQANGGFKKGYYTNPDYRIAHNYGGTNWVLDDFDGTEFYLQFRFKVSSGRMSSSLNSGDGKYDFIATTGSTLTQELVIQSSKNMFLWYTNFGSSPDTGGSLGSGASRQPGGNYATCDIPVLGQNCWNYVADQWVTFMIHVSPGHHNVKDTLLEVFAARPGQLAYETIYSLLNTINFDNGPSLFHPRAYNAFQPSAFCNGLNSNTTWQQRYDQIIFSKNFIPCPQV